MRIALVNPISGYFRYDAMSMPPLGILYVAACLRENGHEVALLDRNVQFFRGYTQGVDQKARLQDVNRATAQCLARFDPQMIGITMMTCQTRDVASVSMLARKTLGHDPLIVAGGYHPTADPESVFRIAPQIDCAARGPGEWTLLELANGVPVDRVHGLSFRPRNRTSGWTWLNSIVDSFRPSSGACGLTHNPDRAIDKTRIFAYPPARDLIDESHYCRSGDGVISYYYVNKPMSLVTSQGCPKRCNFCASRLMESMMYFHPVARVIDEIGTLLDRHGATGLFFYDINFPVFRRRTRELMEAFLHHGFDRKMKWLACASADDLPRELLPLMQKAGCIGLVFGFESASQRVLDRLNKKTKAHKNQEAVDACVANGIRPQSGFIVGVPGETEQDIDASLDFIARNDLMSSLSILLPLPGTEINRELIAAGRLNPDHPDYYGLIADTNAPLIPERVFSDIPFDRFVAKYEAGIRDVCAPTWKTIYPDQLHGSPDVRMAHQVAIPVAL